MIKYFNITKNHKIVPCLMHEVDGKNRRIQETTINNYWISTVFSNIDHNYLNEGPPLLFETMVFLQKDGIVADWLEISCKRCSTYDEAIAQHNQIVEEVKTWKNEQ